MPAGFDEFLRDAIARVATIATSLPEAYEEDAWIGVRWRIRQRTFAHVAIQPVKCRPGCTCCSFDGVTIWTACTEWSDMRRVGIGGRTLGTLPDRVGRAQSVASSRRFVHAVRNSSRRMCFMTLPEAVRGKASTVTKVFGIL